MIRGEFKLKNSSGTPNTYLINDIVSYQGKVYRCVIPTHKSPIQKPDSWVFTGVMENTITDNPPVKPSKGQIWTSTSGVSYVWFKDENGSQWVET
jgi:hypothetical protein